MSKTDAQITDLLSLRLLVAALGERLKPAWWRTTFLTETGLRVTGRLFPRTALAAAIKSTSAAAGIDHDRHIGVGGRYHLFRLPDELERAISEALSQESVRRALAEATSGTEEALIERLEALAAGTKAEPAEGPVRVGPASSLTTGQCVAAMASHYLAALAYGKRRFPYFEETESKR